MKRVEKHKIKKSNKYFQFILEQLEQCKKISNSATFIIRQIFSLIRLRIVKVMKLENILNIMIWIEYLKEIEQNYIEV